jgi:hypothetical protein
VTLKPAVSRTGTVSETAYPVSTLPDSATICREYPSARTMSVSRETRARLSAPPG